MSYGSANDYSKVLSSATEGAGSAMKGAAQFANTKSEAKEAKRRTLAKLMQNSMKRNRNLFKTGQEYNDDLNDTQSQSLQQVARGFVEALQGSTGRGR